MNRLLNEDCSYPGIYMAKVIPDGADIRVYVPGIMTSTQEISLLPKALWCAYNLESTMIENIVEPMMIMFEGGDVKRPVIISYTVVGGAGEESDGTSGNSTGNSSNIDENSGAGINASGSSLVGEVQKYLGTPYVWGGTSPSGFDCSGLMQYVYGKNGISIPRTTQEQFKAAGTKVSRSNLQPGDIIFFGSNSQSISHVGMYIGDGKMIHAPHTGDVVKISSIDSDYYKSRFQGGGRY